LIDLHVISAFMEAHGSGIDKMERQRVQRVLELVDEIAQNARHILPLLTTLQNFDDQWVRSKLAAIWARHVGATPWVSRQLQDGDPRIRANAVEGLWQAPNTSEKRHLLLRAEKDAHQRVVGNAMVGLIRMGEHGATSRLEALAQHPAADFRASAAWAMGEIADPSFRNLLLDMTRDTNLRVRQNALKALSRVRKAQETPAEPGQQSSS
jgi:HEAT repeat protein